MATVIPSYDDIYGSEFLNPVDLSGKKIRVIFSAADVRELRCQNQKNYKIVLSAKLESGTPCKKLIAVNKTSAKVMCLAWGKPDTKTGCKNWLGKIAELSHAKVQAFGALKDCVLITPVESSAKVQVIHEDEPLGDEPGTNEPE